MTIANKIFKAFDENIKSYEQGDDFNLLSACRAKYGDVVLEDFLDSQKQFILQQVRETVEELVPEEKNYDYLPSDEWNDCREEILNKLNKEL